MECRVEGCQRPILVKRDALCAIVMRSKSRRCRTCERENARRYYHEKRAANAG